MSWLSQTTTSFRMSSGMPLTFTPCRLRIVSASDRSELVVVQYVQLSGPARFQYQFNSDSFSTSCTNCSNCAGSESSTRRTRSRFGTDWIELRKLPLGSCLLNQEMLSRWMVEYVVEHAAAFLRMSRYSAS